MEYIGYVLIPVTIILIVILIKQHFTLAQIRGGAQEIAKQKEIHDQTLQLQEELNKTVKEFNAIRQQTTNANTDYQVLLTKIRLDRENYETARTTYQKAIADLEASRLKQEASQQEVIDANISRYYLDAKTTYERTLREALCTLQGTAQSEMQEFEDDISEKKTAALAEIEQIKTELADWSKMRQTINEDILRARAVSEQQDFYRVVLSDDDKADVQTLLDAKIRLHNHDNLDKLIYDGYIAKPVNEMIKRVLKGDTACGIYKITRLKTGEIYIGKSTDVKSRWQQHAKSAFNVGTIAHSMLHTTMEHDGIDNFTFELIEECSKDELGAREKFYIDLYGSKEYGLNERAGG